MRYETYIIRSLVLRKPIELDRIPKTLVEQARKNKVLYALGLYDARILKTGTWLELEKRRNAQIRSIIEVMNFAEKLRIRLLIVKTLKPFEYVPDDVDILIIDDEHLQIFVDALLKQGYFVRKKGTPEVTLRKVDGGTFVDLDIHTKMGAGPYEYIDKHYLWRRRVYGRLGDEDVITPNDIDELLIAAAHAILKEFTVTLADIIHIVSLIFLNKRIVYEAISQARYTGLLKPLGYLLSLAYQTLAYSLKELKQHGITTPKFPCKVPMTVVASAYLENLRYKLKVRRLRPIKELLKIPSSKGIGTLLRHVGL